MVLETQHNSPWIFYPIKELSLDLVPQPQLFLLQLSQPLKMLQHTSVSFFVLGHTMDSVLLVFYGWSLLIICSQRLFCRSLFKSSFLLNAVASPPFASCFSFWSLAKWVFVFGIYENSQDMLIISK
jgi:hypothetical protein